MITAKVKCIRKDETGEGDNSQVYLQFYADYDDGRNQEWARYTPSLSLNMTVKPEAAGGFEVGRAYTLQFVEDE